MSRSRTFLLLAVLTAAAAPSASGQNTEVTVTDQFPDSVEGPDCAPVDSAVVDSAVQAALAAARGPRPITPRLIEVERTSSAAYGSLDAVPWQTLDVATGTQLAVGAVHTDPATRTRQFLLRLPSGGAVPVHWHGAHETLLVVRGSVVVRDAADRVVRLTTGGFSYQPAGARHSLATAAEGGALLLVTSDGTWDIHFPEEPAGTPTPPDSVGAARTRGLGGRR